MDIILIGKQGSGKGTQGKMLAEKFGFQVFETGAVLRKLATESTPLARKVREITTRGDLVPNEIVMEIVENFLENAGESPVIFDGIPRSEIQRKSLENLLRSRNRDFFALEIQISDNSALERLLIRARCNDCGTNFGGDACPACGSKNFTRRADDNRVAIEKRLQNFADHTAPILKIWEKSGKLISIDGESDPKSVFELVKKAVREKN